MSTDQGAFICTLSWVGNDSRLREDHVYYRYGQLFTADGRLIPDPGFIYERDTVGAVVWASDAVRAWYYQNAQSIRGKTAQPVAVAQPSAQPVVSPQARRSSVGLVILALVVALALLGSGAVFLLLSAGASPSQQATFVSYETEGAPPSLFDDRESLFPRTQRELTGYATVDLGDGTRVTALCPIDGLRAGDAVTVQQNGDGTWAVTGR